MRRGARPALLALLLVAVSASSLLVYRHVVDIGGTSPATRPGIGSGALVVDWNRELAHIVNTPGAQPSTLHATRSFAIMQAALYDAVVATTHTGSPYLFAAVAAADARPDAAAAQAAHDTLAALYPTFGTELDQQLAAELASVPDGSGKHAGARVGRITAEAVIGLRANDGSAQPPTPLPDVAQPGGYRPTPPNFTAPLLTQWAGVKPFVLVRADQFRPAAPDLGSVEYRHALTEVFQFGEDTSRFRTADQTLSARFWPGPIWVTWNEIAENAATAHRLDLPTAARLFVELAFSFADTAIAFYDAKYAFQVARPITEIREVESQAQWTPLLVTPADPSYPGAHSAISAAGAAVLASFFGDQRRVTAVSDALPGVTRSFDSYSAAAADAGLSRIYGGVHTRVDHNAGLALGHAVAEVVLHGAGSGWS